MGLPSVWNNDVGQASLLPPKAGAPEYYIPLYWDSIGAGYCSVATAGSAWLTWNQSYTTVADKRAYTYMMPSNWSSTQKFAFEATIYCGSNGSTSYAALWDFTTSSVVSASQISSINGSPASYTFVRSGNFTLTPGHNYGVTMWSTAGGTANSYATDASLIVVNV